MARVIKPKVKYDKKDTKFINDLCYCRASQCDRCD